MKDYGPDVEYVTAAEVAAGDVLVGTGPSGLYPNGIRLVVVSVEEAIPTDARRPERRLWLASGGAQVYYAATTVLRRRGS